MLLHGMARTARSMRPVARALDARGFRVVNLDYPSRSGDIRALAQRVAEEVARIDSDEPMHFVTHSLGGVRSRSVNPLLSRLLPGENDGKVSVAHAAAPGMSAFIVVPHSHSFLMRAKVVLAQTVAFLETGRFE